MNDIPIPPEVQACAPMFDMSPLVVASIYRLGHKDGQLAQLALTRATLERDIAASRVSVERLESHYRVVCARYGVSPSLTKGGAA